MYLLYVTNSDTVSLVRAIVSIQTASTHSECPTLRNPESEDFVPLDEVVNSATVDINTPSEGHHRLHISIIVSAKVSSNLC